MSADDVQTLDLRTDRPDEFEGRSVEPNRRAYVVGPRWREGVPGLRPRAKEPVSRLSLLVLQIRREYRDHFCAEASNRSKPHAAAESCRR